MGLKEIFIKSDEEETPESSVNIPDGGGAIVEEMPFVSSSQPATINSVYEKAGLADMSKSIFKVKQIRASFPNTVADEVVRQALPGLLIAANLKIDEIQQDASGRISTLSIALDQYTKETTGKIQDLTDEINNLAAGIEAKRQEITESQKAMESFERDVNAEIKMIDENLSYIQSVNKNGQGEN